MAVNRFYCRSGDRDFSVYPSWRSYRHALDAFDRDCDGHFRHIFCAVAGVGHIGAASGVFSRNARPDRTFGAWRHDPVCGRFTFDSGVFHRCSRVFAYGAAISHLYVRGYAQTR